VINGGACRGESCEECSFDVQPSVLATFRDPPSASLIFSSQPKTNKAELSSLLQLYHHTSVLYSTLLYKSTSIALLSLSIDNILQNLIDSHPEIPLYKSVFQPICKFQILLSYPYDNSLDKSISYPAKSHIHASTHA